MPMGVMVKIQLQLSNEASSVEKSLTSSRKAYGTSLLTLMNADILLLHAIEYICALAREDVGQEVHWSKH
ncbi:hypothetical protein J1614_008881 [Plenodomus biglobosus]|nr:hypothetical protein J1614_008881 [Plenodomus biglobosus]